MGMVVEEEKSFEGLVEHLQDTFKPSKTLSWLISDFYGWSQKNRETENALSDNLQVFARKIIVWNTSFY